MYIVGIHDGHNASVSLFQDSKLLFALQEERISGEKNASGFPSRALEYMFTYFGISDKDIERYMVASNHMIIEKGISTRQKMLQRVGSRLGIKQHVKNILRKTFIYNIWKKRINEKKLNICEKNGLPREKIEFVEHHKCHANTAYYCSHFKYNERILVITADGGGDRLSCTINIADKGSLRRVAAIPDSSSLGYIYSTATWFLGMVPNEHEYKVMGLAPYAKEIEFIDLKKKLYKIINFKTEKDLVWSLNSKRNTFVLPPFFEKIFKRVRFDKIAGAIQSFTEDLLVSLIRRNLIHYSADKVALSGGVFMNVKANQKISELEEIKDIFVMPSCGDETNSIGAGLEYYARNYKKKEIHPLNGDFCIGPSIDSNQLEKKLKVYSKKYQIRKVIGIEKEIAKLLAENKVVARVKGPMEFGARALGHRSILANPSSYENVKIINDMIKKRDFWMPFAGSFIEEYAHEYFHNPKKIDAPYMIITFNTILNKQKVSKGAIHPQDKTTRPQIVKKEIDPDYWNLINEFRKITGIGCILNTSLNLHGLPLAFDVKDVMHVMENSGLQYLAIEHYLVKKVKSKRNM